MTEGSTSSERHSDPGTRPLVGLRVLEMGTLIAGYANRLALLSLVSLPVIRTFVKTAPMS
ncbi:MAG: hypothetical protein NVS4B11_33690 [Ktedonobacteraceae bacterium]